MRNEEKRSCEAEGSKLKAQGKDSPPRVQRIQRGLEQIARRMGQGAKRSRSWEAGQVGNRKAQGSKRYDDGRLRIKAEAKKSVASNLQPPTAEGLPNHLHHHLKSPWKQQYRRHHRGITGIASLLVFK